MFVDDSTIYIILSPAKSYNVISLLMKKDDPTAGSTCNDVAFFQPYLVATAAIPFTFPLALFSLVPLRAVVVQKELGLKRKFSELVIVNH